MTESGIIARSASIESLMETPLIANTIVERNCSKMTGYISIQEYGCYLFDPLAKRYWADFYENIDNRRIGKHFADQKKHLSV